MSAQENTIPWLEQTNYKPFEELTAEIRSNQIEAVNRIKRMGTVMTVDVNNWDIFEKFKDEHNAGLIITDKRRINEILFDEKLNRENDVSDLELERISKSASKLASDMVKRQIENQANYLYDYEQQLQRKNEEIVGLFEQITSCNTALAKLKAQRQTNTKVAHEVKKILLDPFFKFNAFHERRGIVEFITSVNCVMQDDDANIQLDFGKFKIFLKLKQRTIEVHPHENNRFCRSSNNGGSDYYSPYIGNNGSICWGSRQYDYAKWMVEGEFFEAMQVLKNLLTNYNPDTGPWATMHDFNGTSENRCSSCDNTESDCECSVCTQCSDTHVDPYFDDDGNPFCSDSCRSDYNDY